MTDCNWTERVSLLIDGELAAQEARAVEQHLGDCFACRLAREDFLLLRHQLSSYRPEVNLLAQRRALHHILGSDNAARPAANAGDRRERASGLFALPRFGPALVAASALVLVGLVVGLLMLRDRTPNEIAVNPQPNSAQGNANVTQSPVATPQSGRPRVTIAPDSTPQLAATKDRPAIQNLLPDVRGGGDKIRPKGGVHEKIRPKGAGGLEIAEADDLPLIIPPRIPTDSGAPAAAGVAFVSPDPRPEADPTGLSASRHAEQAQQLLRSFRNAERGGGDNLAYERERSQALLYQNILLRREAASSGNVAVESVLGSLEPILVDIANLSDKPAREDVRSINERMKKKDIVAQLQIAARD